MKPYTPISCAIYDELVLLAQRKSPCLFEIKTSSTSEQFHGTIKDIYTKDGVEYLVTSHNQHFRLDALQIIDKNQPAHIEVRQPATNDAI